MAVAPQVVIVGGSSLDVATDQLDITQSPYTRKSLISNPPNWERIIELLSDPPPRSAILRLNGRSVRLLNSDTHRDVGERLMAALSRVAHLVFAHEALLIGEEAYAEVAAIDDDEQELGEDLISYWRSVAREDPGRTPSPDDREHLLDLIERHELKLVPYRTNAEMKVRCDQFLGEEASDLLFRLYVPSGRMYAQETDRLLRLFADYLLEVKGQRVRQDGYRTSSGRVVELYADGGSPTDLAAQIGDFSRFLALCDDDPRAAEALLVAEGASARQAEELVPRYARDGKRLSIDLRHEHERRTLELRQRLEGEMLELEPSIRPSPAQLGALVDQALPAPSPAGALAPTLAIQAEHVEINQQIIQRVDGAVMQSVQGPVVLGADAQALLELIAQHGGAETAELEAAVHELEDTEARAHDRLKAKQTLKSFLVRAGGQIGKSALDLSIRYLEHVLGVDA